MCLSEKVILELRPGASEEKNLGTLEGVNGTASAKSLRVGAYLTSSTNIEEGRGGKKRGGWRGKGEATFVGPCRPQHVLRHLH